MWLGAWICLLVWGVVTTQILPVIYSNAGTSELAAYDQFARGWARLPGVKAILSPWLRWDTTWYLIIAKYGYQARQASTAFPPLYPLATRLVGQILGGQYLLGALLVSWSAFFGACYLLVDWIKAEKMQVLESRVIQFMLFFPTGFFFFAGYTESLFLLFALLGWRFAIRGKWVLTGILGALAILTRFIGVCLFIPFLSIFWDQFRAGKTRWTSVLWLGLMPAAYIGWSWYSRIVYGVMPSDALHLNWAQHFDWPWIGLLGSIEAILTRPISDVYFAYIDLIVVGIAVFSTGYLLREKKVPEGLFVLAVLLISLVKVTDQGLLGSVGRFLIPVFPLYLYQPKILEKSIVARLILYVSISLWLMSSAMFFTWNWIA